MRPLLLCILAFTAEAASSSAPIAVAPTTLSFAYQTGSLAAISQGFFLSGPQGTVFTATKPVDATWLLLPNGGNGTSVSGTLPALFPVSVNPVGLPPGTRSTTIQFQTPGGAPPVPVSVSLFVTAAPVILASPGVLIFDYTASAPGTRPFSTIAVAKTQNTPLLMSASTNTPWLSTSGTGSTIQVTADPAKVPGDIAVGSVQATTTGVGNSPLSIPVIFLRKGADSQGPNITRVVNAASWADGPLAPGEIVTLGGTAIGPSSLAGLALDSSGNVATTVAGVQALFNGTLGPMVYASATQVSAVVPYEVAGAANVNVQLVNNGVGSNVLAAPATAAVPGVFAANASGSGPGAILNQDNTLNGPGNPASKGSIVTLYVTGEGQTNPPGVTGKVTSAPYPAPAQPYSVTIGGQAANVTFAGEAPGYVSGFLQVNVEVPASAPSGDVPVVVTIGGIPSQDGLTVSVR